MKYTLDKTDSIIEDGITLYRVIYQEDLILSDKLLPISKGTKGGYVESELNLSQQGKCFLLGRSIIMNNSRVEGDTQIHGDVKIYGQSYIIGNSNISNNVKIYESDIKGDYNISNNVKMDHAWLNGKGLIAGRFSLEDISATNLTLIPIKANTEHIAIIDKDIPVFNFYDLLQYKVDKTEEECILNIIYPGYISFCNNVEEIGNLLRDNNTLNDFFQIPEEGRDEMFSQLLSDRITILSQYDDTLWDYNYA